MSSPDSPDHKAIDRDFAPPDAGPDRDPRSILIDHGIRDNTDTNQILPTGSRNCRLLQCPPEYQKLFKFTACWLSTIGNVWTFTGHRLTRITVALIERFRQPEAGHL